MADISKFEERYVYYEFDENEMKNIKEMRKMITLRNNYFIDADSRQYILKRKTDHKNKNGDYLFVNEGYYSSVQSALLGYVDIVNREVISKNDMKLKDAIEQFNRIKDDIKQLV